MADIFISYAHEDEPRIRELVPALEKYRWSIFWDRRIPAGKSWQSYIGKALSEAKCVIVVWSQHSITSEWVIEEANDAKERGCIVPVRLDSVKPPLGFRGIQAADLTDWKPDSFSHRFDELIRDIAGVLGGQPQLPSSEEDLTPKHQPEAPKQRVVTNNIGMNFVILSVGSFTMGGQMSPKEIMDRFGGKEEWYEREKPHHTVKIDEPIYLQTTPVTQDQWQRVMGDNPSYSKDSGNDCPVEQVSWEAARRFIEKLNDLEKTKAYRLPTEAEWEYACRAGSETEFSFGNDPGRLGEFAWFGFNSSGRTHPVGEKKPNAWGLYDMYGNVWEWVEDDLHDDYNGAPDDGSAWIDSPRGSSRVLRGGCWRFVALLCRSAARRYGPDLRSLYVGFRHSRSVALGP
jgi:formylglycine-generating enzyme required for sulfatase activity